MSLQACKPDGDPLLNDKGPPTRGQLDYAAVRAGLPSARNGQPPNPNGPPKHFEVLPGTVPSWAPLFQDCQTVASMPSGRSQLGSASDPTVRELVSIGDFIREVTYDTYYWRNSDGAQVKFYQDTEHPNDIYISIAGSSPSTGPDLNSLIENLASQSNAFPRKGYVEFVRQAVVDGIARILPESSEPYRLFLTGHSQGGNVAQVLGVGMLDPEPANPLLSPFQWADGPEWVNFRQTMADRRAELAGIVAVASRPAGPMVKYNRELDGRGALTLYVQSLEDVVPILASPSTVAIPDSHPLTQTWDSVNVFSNMLGGMAGLIPFYSPVWQRIQKREADNLWSRIIANLQGRDVVTTRSQIVFAGNGDRHPAAVERSTVNSHGQQYIDPRVGLGPAAHRGPVTFDDFLQLTAPPSVDAETSIVTISVLGNDWDPSGNEAALKIVEAHMIPRCSLLEYDPSCPECAPITTAAPPALEAECQGTVGVNSDGKSITYRSPLIGVAENARVTPLEPAIGGNAYFASPELEEGVHPPQTLDSTRLLLVNGAYAEIAYTVEDAEGRQSQGYAKVHLVAPSPDGNPVVGPWQGGPFQAPRAFDRGPEVTWDEREVYPDQAPLSHYLPARKPDQQGVRTPLRLKWMGGYGYDCRAAYAYDLPTWTVDMFSVTGQPVPKLDICTGLTPENAYLPGESGPFAGPKLFSYPEVSTLRNFADDIPDTYWVGNATRHDGSLRDPDYAAKEAAIRQWTLDGATEADGPTHFSEPGGTPGVNPPGNVVLNRTYVNCLPDPVCSSGAPPAPGFAGTACPSAGGDVDWDAMRSEAQSLTDPSSLMFAVEIPYNPPASWPGFEAGPCGSFHYDLPVPCDGYQDYKAWNMGGAIATFRVGPGLPSIFNNWVNNAGYFAEGMMDPFYTHSAKTTDFVSCSGGGVFMGCSFGTFGDGLDDTGLVPCDLARLSTSPGPMQPGPGAYGGRIRAFPVHKRQNPNLTYPVGWQSCYDRISLAAQGGGTPIACQTDGLEHGSIFIAFQATCEEG